MIVMVEYSMRMPPVVFRQISFDAIILRQAANQIFTDNRAAPMDSLSRRDEQALVAWLVGNPFARTLICEVLQRSTDAFIRTEVKQPFYGRTEGDIDILLCNRGAPQESVVVECKRVKVQVLDEGNDRINKLEQVGKDVKQAKKPYEKFVFFQSYLAVISAVEAANQRKVNIPCRGIMPETVPNWDTTTTTF